MADEFATVSIGRLRELLHNSTLGALDGGDSATANRLAERLLAISTATASDPTGNDQLATAHALDWAVERLHAAVTATDSGDFISAAYEFLQVQDLVLETAADSNRARVLAATDAAAQGDLARARTLLPQVQTPDPASTAAPRPTSARTPATTQATTSSPVNTDAALLRDWLDRQVLAAADVGDFPTARALQLDLDQPEWPRRAWPPSNEADAAATLRAAVIELGGYASAQAVLADLGNDPQGRSLTQLAGAVEHHLRSARAQLDPERANADPDRITAHLRAHDAAYRTLFPRWHDRPEWDPSNGLGEGGFNRNGIQYRDRRLRARVTAAQAPSTPQELTEATFHHGPSIRRGYHRLKRAITPRRNETTGAFGSETAPSR